MGYNLKKTYCDLAELEKEGIATISTTFGTNSLERNKAKGKTIVDFRLGRLGDFKGGFTTSSFKGQRASLMEPFSPTPGSSKRGRTSSSGSQIASCLVDGCKSDLSKCRDYHRRHKVCEIHSKTPKVSIGGHEQRFCQQCSRFHSLGEFDEGKRSCRKRLEGHNRRRRKPQPETLTVNHGNFLAASQGSRFLPFSNQPMISASSVVSTTWSGAVKHETDPTPYDNSVSGSYSQAYATRQFPFLQGPDSTLTVSSSTGQTFQRDYGWPKGNVGSSSTTTVTATTTTTASNNGQKTFCDGLNQVVIDSNRALSLLSSSPSQGQAPEMGLGRVIHSSPINPGRSMLGSSQYNSIEQYHGFQGHHGGGSSLISNSDSLCHDVFQSEPDGSSSTGGHQTLSFSWE